MMPNEHPILFKDEMVRAIFEGRKTQTRRLKGLEQINQDPDAWWYDGQNIHNDYLFRHGHGLAAGHDPQDTTAIVKSPYGQPGDRLWGRETWRAVERESDGVDGVLYRADGQFRAIENSKEAAEKWMEAYANGKWGKAWRPSIFLPRWASRLLLDVVTLRPERLHDISEEDAIAEGLERTGGDRYWMGGTHPVKGTRKVFGLATQAFASIWDEINGKHMPWARNPWVWVVEFRGEVSR